MTWALETAVVINAYVPNSGEGLKRLRERIEVWEPAMKAHVECVKKEMKNKPIVWLGDFNVAHEKTIYGVTGRKTKAALDSRRKNDARFQNNSKTYA